MIFDYTIVGILWFLAILIATVALGFWILERGDDE